MNPFQNAFRVITGRYKDDFQWGEDRFENEDGPERNDREDDDGDQPELEEAA
jgi:hypothetical protein